MPKLIKLYYDLLNQPSRAVFMFFEINQIPYDPVPTNIKGIFFVRYYTVLESEILFVVMCYVKLTLGILYSISIWIFNSKRDMGHVVQLSQSKFTNSLKQMDS